MGVASSVSVLASGFATAVLVLLALIRYTLDSRWTPEQRKSLDLPISVLLAVFALYIAADFIGVLP